MEWTIQDLGAIGEFVGAIAVVVTLAYLAVQIRQNTAAMRAQSTTTVAQLAQATFLATMASPDITELMAREEHGEALTESERRRLFALRMALFAAFENIYLHHREGFAPDEVAASRDSRVVTILNTEAARQWWGDNKRHFAQGFQQHVDALLNTSK
ncbi:MAG: hypothetical protein P8Y95_04210 [Gammaproteobacteria bacterium]|jgi:hypothetical protein